MTTVSKTTDSSGRPSHNMSEVAYLLNKTTPTIRAWVQRGCPYSRTGAQGRGWSFDIGAVVAWREQQAVSNGEAAEELDLTAERARLTYHQANKTALEESVLSGALIPADIVKETWASLVVSFRAKMIGLPSKAAPQIIGVDDLRETEQILQDFIYDALSELSGAGTSSYSPGSDTDGKAAAKDDGKSVGGRKKEVKPGKQRGTGRMEDESSGVPAGHYGCA